MDMDKDKDKDKDMDIKLEMELEMELDMDMKLELEMDHNIKKENMSGIIDVTDSAQMPVTYRGKCASCAEPTTFEVLLYKSGARCNLFLTASFRLAENSFITATFLMDTRCSHHFVVGPTLMALLRSRLVRNDVGHDYIETTVNGIRVKCAVAPAPNDDDDVNLVGLPLFFLLGLEFEQDALSHFCFDKDNIARNVVAMSSVSYF